MEAFRKINWLGLMLACAILFVITAPALAGEITLIGEVNDNYQLVAEGQVYEIADTPKGNEMAENFISVKVKVTGTVEDGGEMKTITVEKFEVMPE